MGEEYCCVAGCKSRIGPEISFHRFPNNPLIRKKWIENLQIKIPVKYYTKVCSVHFDSSCFIDPESTAKNMASDGMDVMVDSTLMASAAQNSIQNEPRVTSGSPTFDGGTRTALRNPSDFSEPTPEMLLLHKLVIANLQKNVRILEIDVESHRQQLHRIENSKNAQEARDCEQSCWQDAQENPVVEDEEGNKPVSDRPTNDPKVEGKAANVQKDVIAPSAEDDRSGLREKLREDLVCSLGSIEHDAKAGCKRASFLIQQFKFYAHRQGCWSFDVMLICAEWLARCSNAYNYVRRRKILMLPGPNNAHLKQITHQSKKLTCE